MDLREWWDESRETGLKEEEGMLKVLRNLEDRMGVGSPAMCVIGRVDSYTATQLTEI